MDRSRPTHAESVRALQPRPRLLKPLDNLPHQVSSFVGRDREIAETIRLLSRTRLLTLTGPGGIGKTRLALAGAKRSVDRHEDGIWLVGVACVSDPPLVPVAV